MSVGLGWELAQATVVGHYARLADLAPNVVAAMFLMSILAGTNGLCRDRVPGSPGHRGAAVQRAHEADKAHVAARWCVVAGVVVVVACGCRRNGVVFDGFEEPDLSKYWQTKKFLPGAVEIQSTVVRTGRGAARITLRPGDQIPQEEGSELERAELRESKRLWPVEESAYEYSFSLFVPQDFPITSTRLVIAQWKHSCPVEECTPGHPTLAIRYEAGELFITKQATAKREVLYRVGDDIRNRWLDFRFRIRFSRTQNGRIRGWLGDRMIIDHTGRTAYPRAGGYTGRAVFYFKVGLYRDRMSEPMTLYVDDYRRQRLPNDLV